MLDVADAAAEITLQPGEYRIYTTKQLEQPDITISVGEFKNTLVNGNLNVYPNPTDNVLYISEGKQLVQLSISNIFGQQVYVQKSSTGFIQISVQNFEKGMYVITGTDKEGKVYTAKFIKQ